MLDWYITHVYVLPWWAYAVMLYALAGAFVFRCFELYQGQSTPPVIVFAFVVGWPYFLGALAITTVFWVMGWLLGFTDTPPLSLSKEGGYIE